MYESPWFDKAPRIELIALLERLASNGGQDHQAFDELVRASFEIDPKNISAWESFLRWETLAIKYRDKPKKGQFWKRKPAFPDWVNLASESGYEREGAILSLKEGAPNKIFFALLTRRLNDWVPQVRAAAEKKIVEVARASDPNIIASAICTVLSRWIDLGRWTEQEKLRLIEIVELKPVSKALCGTLISSPSGPMSLVLSQACRSNALDEYLPAIAANAIQPAVRARSYRMLLEQKARWIENRVWQWTDIRYCEGKYVPILGERAIDKTESAIFMIDQALNDQSARVRRIAAEKFIQHMDEFGERAAHVAGELARDQSKSVAERGRFAQRRLEEQDV